MTREEWDLYVIRIGMTVPILNHSSHRCSSPRCRDPVCVAIWQAFYEAGNPAVKEEARRILREGTSKEVQALMARPEYCNILTYDESNDLICKRAGELPGDLRRGCCQKKASDGRTCVRRPADHEGECQSLVQSGGCA